MGRCQSGGNKGFEYFLSTFAVCFKYIFSTFKGMRALKRGDFKVFEEFLSIF
jgi:hypothetical protein